MKSSTKEILTLVGLILLAVFAIYVFGYDH